MTTDWKSLRRAFKGSPKDYTSNMVECFIFDNTYGFSIRELSILFNIPAQEVIHTFDIGLKKYKFLTKKGGLYNEYRNS